jgi:MFS superfamily sulfate permease-like transporter
MLNEILQGKRLERYVPFVGWITSYQRAWLRDDAVSGIVVGLIMIPVAMAYAQMAGVPPQAGLYSAIVGMTAYAIFATSKHLKITASSTMSIMSIAIVAPLAVGGPDRLVALAGALALMTGALCILAGLAKFGFITDLLSKPVRIGYLNGIALTVLIGQLPKILGFSSSGDNLIQETISLYRCGVILTNRRSLRLALRA